MSEQKLPALPGLTWSVTKKPMWSTRVQRSRSGREVRTKDYIEPLTEFGLPYDFLRDKANAREIDILMGFVNQMGGRFDSFLYQDPSDGYALNEFIATGNGTQTIFQLTRTLGGSVQLIADPDLATLTFGGGMWDYADDPLMWNPDGNTLMWSGDAGSFTYLGQGRVQFSTPPPNGQAVAWSGAYYYRCRFLQDAYEFEQWCKTHWKLGKLDFVGSLSGQI